mmetsp:Transcript_6504/g.11961  ORF Transcript_6504/g.11961 Transcript_6504/m.11961 type:complete len:353 (-) Transcript_6504:614-1672(-)
MVQKILQVGCRCLWLACAVISLLLLVVPWCLPRAAVERANLLPASRLPFHYNNLRSSLSFYTTSGCHSAVEFDDDFRVPKPYPTTFHIQFVTNITSCNNSKTISSSGGDNDNDNSCYPINGTLYYDWSQRAQRIDHDPGSYECVRFYNTTGGCTLLFLIDGMYRILRPVDDTVDDSKDEDMTASSKTTIDCCLDLPNVGPPPPDWASQAPSTWRGVIWDEYGQVLAKEWWFDRFEFASATTKNSGAYYRPDCDTDDSLTALQFHTVRQVAFDPPNRGTGYEAGLPVVFTFPGKANGRQDMHYLFHTMNHSLPQGKLVTTLSSGATSLFDLPKGCRHRRCPQPKVETLQESKA